MNVYDGAELTDAGARFWLAMDGWKVDEAAYLLHAIDPMRLNRWAEMSGGKLEVEFPAQFDVLRAMIARAFESGALSSPARPHDVIAWAKSKQLKLPKQFLDAHAAWHGDEPPIPLQAIDSATGLINRNEVMATFPVKADADENCKFWDGKLSRPPRWLIDARINAGKPGTSALWNPLMLAHCLLAAGHMTLNRLDVVMNKRFPELADSWREQTGDKR